MEALLSLPVIGYLFYGGGVTSNIYTGLNFMFFYMTWSTLIFSHPPMRVEIVGTLLVRIVFFLLPSTFMLLADSILPSIVMHYKTQGDAGLPTRGRATSRHSPVWYQVIAVSLFNILFGLLIQAGIELLLTKVLHINSALQVSMGLPLPWTIFKQVAGALVLREILQYYIHSYILHSSEPNLFRHFHESYYHSITAPYSFAAHFDHPVAYLLHKFIPAYLPSALLHVHLLTYLITLSIITMEETFISSGYVRVPGFLMSGMARRHDGHSESRGKGNFSPFGVLDWFHATGLGGNAVSDTSMNLRRGSEQEHRRKSGGSPGITAASLRSFKKKAAR